MDSVAGSTVTTIEVLDPLIANRVVGALKSEDFNLVFENRRIEPRVASSSGRTKSNGDNTALALGIIGGCVALAVIVAVVIVMRRKNSTLPSSSEVTEVGGFSNPMYNEGDGHGEARLNPLYDDSPNLDSEDPVRP